MSSDNLERVLKKASFYQKGEFFTSIDLVNLTKSKENTLTEVNQNRAAGILLTMVGSGDLYVKRLPAGNQYKSKALNRAWLTKAWRSVSNESLGIAPDRLGLL